MELKVHLEHDPRFRGTTMYLYGKDKDGEFVIEPMNLVRKAYEPGVSGEPTLIFSGHDGEQFLQSLGSTCSARSEYHSCNAPSGSSSFKILVRTCSLP